MEDVFNQPAVIGSVIAGTVAIILALFSFWSNKIYAQDLDEFKKILDIQKMLLDLKKKGNFDEYIRIKSNYLSLVKTLGLNKFKLQLVLGNKKKNFLMLLCFLLSMICFILGFGFSSLSPLIASILIGINLGVFIEIIIFLYSSSSLEAKLANTRYWLRFKDGPLKGKSFHLPINLFINFNKRSNLCYPFIAFKDVDTKKI